MAFLGIEFKRKESNAVEYQVFNDAEAGQVEASENYEGVTVKKESYSTPFMEVGNGNLSLPYINNNYADARGFVRFGKDNLFPQLVNQMYFTSPLNGSIIDFKTNSIAGGGYEIKGADETPQTKARILVFENRNKVKKLYRSITRDLVMHYSCYFLVEFGDEKQPKRFTRLSPEKVRKSKGRKLYFICDDWSTQIGIKPVRPYNGKVEANCTYILPYEIDSVGQDEYSIAPYSSAFNWCYLDGEMSYLHKSNIKNSIFPSFALLFPKKPGNDKERNSIKSTIEGAKGAPNAGRIFALFANNKEQLPEIAPIPTNNNDKLFEQTDERIDAQICKAHTIDPLLMGIRVSGKLGSGNDIQQAYIIYEKNTVIPFREYIEEAFNELLKIWGIRAKFVLNNYQIINEKIVETETDTNKIYEQLSKLSPLVANKVLESLTVNEIRGMGGAARINGGDKVTITKPVDPAAAAGAGVNTPEK